MRRFNTEHAEASAADGRRAFLNPQALIRIAAYRASATGAEQVVLRDALSRIGQRRADLGAQGQRIAPAQGEILLPAGVQAKKILVRQQCFRASSDLHLQHRSVARVEQVVDVPPDPQGVRHQRLVGGGQCAIRLPLFLLPVQRQPLFDAAALLNGLDADGVAICFQSFDIRGFDHQADSVPPIPFIRGQEYIGVGALLLLFDPHPCVEGPRLVEQIGRVVVHFSPRAGVRTGTDAEAQAMRRPLAHIDADRGGPRTVVCVFGRVRIERYPDGGKIGGCLQCVLQDLQLFFSIRLAGLDGAVVAANQGRRVAMQTLDAQFPETVARPRVVVGPQSGAPGFGVDFGFAVHETGSGMLDGEQSGQYLLLGVAPVLLPEWLANRQAPIGGEAATGRLIDGAVDDQIDIRNGGSWPRIDTQAWFSVRIDVFEHRREVSFGSQHFAEHGLQAARGRCLFRQIALKYFYNIGRPLQHELACRSRRGKQREQQRSQIAVQVPGAIGHHCILSGHDEVHATLPPAILRHNQRRRKMIHLTTTPTLEGKRITRYCGIVAGEAVLGANVFKDMFAGIRDIVGGRSGTYEKELRKARQYALDELAEQAGELGANAVVGIDIDYEVLGEKNGMLMVTACGTAVVAE